MPKLIQSQVNDLETLVDATSLADVLEALAEIANGKAEHLRANWQDTQGASLWERAARRINHALSRWPADI